MVYLKESMYNFWVNSNSKKIVYNSCTGKHCVLTFEEFDRLNSLLMGTGGLSKKDPLIKKLYESGILVDSVVDELAVVLSRKEKYIDTSELFLMILPTEQCNFRCEYCYENFERPHMSSKTVNGIKELVRENLKYYHQLTVAWFGGEPMLTMNIVDELSTFFLDLCKKERKLYFSMMTTNGSLLTPSNWERLKKDHVTGYQITLDGLERTHDSQRKGRNGEPTWQTIVNNL